MSEAYFIDAVRTPIGKFRGSLSYMRADDLAAFPISVLLSRFSELDPSLIENVFYGCANQAGEDNRNVARMASLLAGLPSSVPACTVNRLCASGMDAIIMAYHAIKANEGDLFIAGGVEHMTRAPLVMSKSTLPFSGKVEVHDTTLGWRFINSKMKAQYGIDSMGKTAENLVSEYKISRYKQDEFAYQSQMKATKARQLGFFRQEIDPLLVPCPRKGFIRFEEDEFIRPQTTLEVLSTLKPVFRFDGKGSVTAGNSSGLNDGSCALLIASEKAVKAHHLKPKARIISSASVGVEPRCMGIGPVGASRKALKRAGLRLAQVDLIELNEAFSVQCLSVMHELGLTIEDTRINRYGGAISLGHPLGMSGARIVASAMFQLQMMGSAKYALCTLCVGVGQGETLIIEKI